MTNEFINYHQKRLATEKKTWNEDMKETYNKVDSSREKIQELASNLEEHLRNKWSQEDPNYKEQEGYLAEIREVRKLKRLEEDLYKTLYKVRKF